MTGVDSDTSQDIAEAISLKGGRYLSLVTCSSSGKPVYCGSRNDLVRIYFSGRAGSGS
jgi:hypothetical protein